MKHKHGDCVQCEDNERQQLEWARKIEEWHEHTGQQRAGFWNQLAHDRKDMMALAKEMKE